jgi:hypothetical protein
MPEVVISLFDANNAVPNSIREYINNYQWSLIHSTISQVESIAHGVACCCECSICILFAFPCIFLCHPCIYGTLSTCRARR